MAVVVIHASEHVSWDEEETMLRNFQWYRRMRGGKWSRVTGFLWGRRWVHVPDACVEPVEEDWRNISWLQPVKPPLYDGRCVVSECRKKSVAGYTLCQIHLEAYHGMLRRLGL